MQVSSSNSCTKHSTDFANAQPEFEYSAEIRTDHGGSGRAEFSYFFVGLHELLYSSLMSECGLSAYTSIRTFGNYVSASPHTKMSVLSSLEKFWLLTQACLMVLSLEEEKRKWESFAIT